MLEGCKACVQLSVEEQIVPASSNLGGMDNKERRVASTKSKRWQRHTGFWESHKIYCTLATKVENLRENVSNELISQADASGKLLQDC